MGRESPPGWRIVYKGLGEHKTYTIASPIMCMEEETKEVIEHLKANVETLQSENATAVEQSVALEQAEYHVEKAHELFKANH